MDIVLIVLENVRGFISGPNRLSCVKSKTVEVNDTKPLSQAFHQIGIAHSTAISLPQAVAWELPCLGDDKRVYLRSPLAVG